MHVTSSGVFNNNSGFPLNNRKKEKKRKKKKIARNCIQHYECVFRVELDKSQCKCVEFVHSNGEFCVRLSMLRIV